MRDIPLGRSIEVNQAVDKTIERSDWGLLLVWIGIALLAKLGWGVGLLGIGIIILGGQVARRYFGLSGNGFALVLGLCFFAAGIWQLLELRFDMAPISVWLVPGLLIVAGVSALVSAWRHRPGA